MSSRLPAGWSHVPMLSRFTVPPLRRIIRSAPPAAAFGTWNSLRCAWPPKSGSGSRSRIFASGAEAVAVELRRREAARAGADDDAVVAPRPLVDDGHPDARAAALGAVRAAASASGWPSIL